MSSASSSGPVGALAVLLGASEPALRLLISILAGYPLAACHRKFLQDQPQTIQHIYFASTGFLICVFNYGFDVYHSLISIWLTYLFVRVMYNSKYLIPINFIFHMGYLLIGYYYTESDDYDIKWTMPHCVLVLRLIGFAYDIYDGKLPNEKLSKDQKETALKEIPSILELTAFTYFPASFLVGPQFPYRRYQRFVRGEFKNHKGSTESGLIRGGLGILYLIIRQVVSQWVPDSYLLSTEFSQLSFVKRLFLLGLWGKISLYKYISCWLLAEGALTCFGLTYVGLSSESGTEDWSGCSNVKLSIFESASKMEHYVQSFNVNTNHWVAQYVYKRLKFLGNRTMSYAGALLFLAIWHGFHSGYYVCFFLEYLVITFEKQVESVYAQLQDKYGSIINSSQAIVALYIIRRIYTFLCMGWCLLPFIYLSFWRWMHAFSVFNYFGFIILFLWFIGYFIYRKNRPKSSQKEEVRQKLLEKKKM